MPGYLNTVGVGDNVEYLKQLPDNCIDACVTGSPLAIPRWYRAARGTTVADSSAKRQRRYRERHLEFVRQRDAANKRRQRREDSVYAERQRATHRTASSKQKKNARRRTPAARKAQADYMREQRKRPEFKLKERARAAIKRAVSRGDLIPPTNCELCGKNPGRRSDGRRLIRADHHKGYDAENYLNVQWVCPTCDGSLERSRGNTTKGRFLNG